MRDRPRRPGYCPWPHLLGLMLSAAVTLGCGAADPVDRASTGEPNPPAPGFDAAGSDARAIELADATMAAMGGREAWDRTRYLAWNFFGRRFHVWDKQTGNIRVEYPSRSTGEPVVVVMNLGSRTGKAWIGGQALSDPTRLEEHLNNAYEAWINDGYWLFMPYKLKDTGVTLKYAGQQAMLDGRPAEVLEVTFANVGVTPENKYLVYVAEDTGLVEQWDFYETAQSEQARFQTPWHDWQPYGEILLSSDRGQRTISEIAVFDELPAAVFESVEPTGLRAR